METRPGIVVVHGAQADGSSWGDVTGRLQASGSRVTAAQFSLTSLSGDVARLRRVPGLQGGPGVVAGHCDGGQIITAPGGNTGNAAGGVSVAAFGIDQGESGGALLSRGPPSPARAHLPTDKQGSGWPPQDDYVNHVAAELDPVRARSMHATRQAPAGPALPDVMGVPSRTPLPSWYLAATGDQAIPPDAGRMSARGMGATPTEVPSSHLAMACYPDQAAQLITKAAGACGRPWRDARAPGGRPPGWPSAKDARA